MKCALCGGELESKTVEEEVVHGIDRVVVKVNAEVCMNCHERYFSEGVVNKLINLKEDLIKDKTKLHEIGKVYEPVGTK